MLTRKNEKKNNKRSALVVATRVSSKIARDGISILEKASKRAQAKVFYKVTHIWSFYHSET